MWFFFNAFLFKNKIKERLFHVGRLDYLSSGLIFYTNDGEFAQRVIHPSFMVEKQYLVESKQTIQESVLVQYKKGILINTETFRLKDYIINSKFSADLILAEGKNREIRKVFNFYGIKLLKVHRTRVGIVSLKGLAPGDFRYLNRREIKWFLKENSKGSKIYSM